MTDDEIRAAAVEHAERTSAAQNLPSCVDNVSTLARLSDALKRSRERSDAA